MRKIINRSFAFVIIALLLSVPQPQSAVSTGPANEDRVALHQALLDLTNPWTVMCIAAHPDDEDGTSLTVLRHKYGAHTVSLFSTFGEGGQNAIGPELYEELGAIRVRETMAAAEIQGSEPYFLGLKDFGFSKSADEAFKFWGHDEALRRMVLKIRELRPDVIITNHDTTSGHGHHQATGRLELEAFEAAADASKFPEQLKDGLTTWQVQRLFVRAGFGGGNSGQQPDPAGLVTIDPNESDPTRGTTYAEQALAALQKHATQGPWPKTVADMARFRNAPDGKLPLIRYRLTREARGVAAMPPDSHKFYDALQLPDSFAKELDPPTIDGRPLLEFEAERPRVISELTKYFSRPFNFTQDWSNYRRLSLMKKRIEQAFAVAARITIQVELPNKIVTPGSIVNLKIKITNAGGQNLTVNDCSAAIPALERKDSAAKGGPPTIFGRLDTMNVGSTAFRSAVVSISKSAPINVPLASHLYEPSSLGLQLQSSCSFSTGAGVASGFHLEAITRLDVAPEIEIAEISPAPLVIRPPAVGVSSAGADILQPPAPKFSIQLINHLDQPFKGEIVFGEDNRKGETRQAVELLPHQSSTLAIAIPRPTEKTSAAHTRGAAADSVWFSIRRPGSKENVTTSRVPVVWANAHVARRLNVGFVRGFDYSLPNALSALGVESQELSVAEVKTADLQKYGTILIDNRVYESQPDLIAANQRLLEYANNGGTLVVFYHKSNEWNPDSRRNRPQLAPYPLTLNDARITDENAPVTFLEPDHPLLNIPNKIGPEDFAGWIQERGLYYPKDWDAHYHALLSSFDPGEKPLTGGLLVADYGRGHYIYTSMVWYRQLRAGVPGGYRMFANMISYGHQ